MLTVPAMLGAPLHFETSRLCSIAVTAARTTGALVVDAQLDLAEWAFGLDYGCNGPLSLV
jgi:hypothetical protein